MGLVSLRYKKRRRYSKHAPGQPQRPNDQCPPRLPPKGRDHDSQDQSTKQAFANDEPTVVSGNCNGVIRNTAVEVYSLETPNDPAIAPATANATPIFM